MRAPGVPRSGPEMHPGQMSEFWVVAHGGELDGAVGLLELDGDPAGERLLYRGEMRGEVPYVVTPELTTLPDGRSALIALRESPAGRRGGSGSARADERSAEVPDRPCSPWWPEAGETTYGFWNGRGIQSRTSSLARVVETQRVQDLRRDVALAQGHQTAGRELRSRPRRRAAKVGPDEVPAGPQDTEDLGHERGPWRRSSATTRR